MHDVHSHANTHEHHVRHVDLDLVVDFESRILTGSASLRFEPPTRGSGGKLVLDSRDLLIERVEAEIPESGFAEMEFEVGVRDKVLGSSVTIDLPPGADRVRIHYKTSPDASGLQWLDAPQTTSGKHPFLFSQAQAIHARSFVPCQDSPGVRVTFDAVIRTPPEVVAVMGAENRSRADEPGIFRFHMPQAVPPYLIALAVGELTFRSTGPRTGVWAEPGVVERAADEFADAEAMVAATEKLFGEYRWGRFDVLVLPPSFPFGGMENPRLTFATPTVLAGDRSLVSLIAHELAHSWSGNLVTNATWADFWLNEGTTVYIERRIDEAIYGKARAEMEWLLGRRELDETLAELSGEPALTQLEVDLTGRDPDDGMNKVPYEKGALLLRLLEGRFGRDRFDPFLRAWFDDHAFTSRRTSEFEAFVRGRLFGGSPGEGEFAEELHLAEWLRSPGLPQNAPAARSTALSDVVQIASDWLSLKLPTAELPIARWSFHETLHFLRNLPESLPAGRMAELDAAFRFTAVGNSELLHQWLLQSIRSGYSPADVRLREFLVGQGRRKFLKPLYAELRKSEAGRKRAAEIYAEARERYHPIARATIDALLGHA